MTRQQQRRRGLGRGLDALFMDGEEGAATTSIAVDAIVPNSYQPRRTFRQEELDALTESVRRNGVLTPILVRPTASGGYELIAGERRWRAARAAGLATIPALVREVSSAEALAFAIIENEQRDNLTAIESACAYQRLIDEFGYSQQQVAEVVGVSRAQVSNLLRLRQLPEKIQRMIERRELSMGQARPLVGLGEARAVALAEQCAAQGWSARRMEQEARKLAAGGGAARKEGRGEDPDARKIEEEIRRHTGLAVEVRRDRKGGGKLTIPFAHVGELEGLLRRLRSGGEG
ncbi:MAG: ParB/RepB/Spo0J family partition protein [Zetaproteobacteria bacterium]|nr:MAG: ParB/RepB/Spo0J family partition protein [Zetaproteobacteria bacterium]